MADINTLVTKYRQKIKRMEDSLDDTTHLTRIIRVRAKIDTYRSVIKDLLSNDNT